MSNNPTFFSRPSSSLIMIFYSTILSLALLRLPTATARTFTVVNTCTYTIWPAIYTDLSAGDNVPQFPTGWESPPSTSAQFSVPDNWKSGRIWGRRQCNFSSNAGTNGCLDGGCSGGLQCDPNTGTGVPPATVGEWTLEGTGNLDFYDVSLVDGFNIPMSIIPSASNCSVASCPNDLNPGCPSQLVGPQNSTGNPVGCKSACAANLDNNPSNSSNCCTGSYNTNATCPSSGVEYYSYFKNNCPNSYVYAFDESSGTALWTCDSGLNSDYLVTFCPPPYGGQAPAPISAVPTSLIPSATLTPSASSTSSSTTNDGSSGAQPSSSGPAFKSDAVALHRTSMVPGALSAFGVALGWLLMMV